MDKLKRYQNATIMAVRLHGLQSYDNFPYDKHLRDVEDVLVEFGFDKYDDIVIAGWLHDILEDCPISYSAIKREFGEKIAKIIFCVTDEFSDGKGNPLENRAAKKKYTLPKVKSNPDAIVVKVADRIANVRHSYRHNDKMFLTYKKEHKDFYNSLYIKGHIDKMWKHLESLISQTIDDEPYSKVKY